MTEVTVCAPFSGWFAALNQVPDAAFASGMVGPGAAIDPVSAEVLAPFAGTITVLPVSRHAVTIRSSEGVEVLIHIGIDTVKLKGQGFTAHVAEGDRVDPGDLLLSLDLDAIAEQATSLISPVIAVGGAGSVRSIAKSGPVRAGDPILAVAPMSDNRSSEPGPEVSVILNPVLPVGLHARPAARIAACIRDFDARVELRRGDHRADATSLVQMMGLGVTSGDELIAVAAGRQAQAALDALTALIEAGLEDALPARAPAAVSAPAATAPSKSRIAAQRDGEVVIPGVTASRGLATGIAVRLRPVEIVVPDTAQSEADERRTLDDAVVAVRSALETEAAVGDIQRREILAAHRDFLSDPALVAQARDALARGCNAAQAWREATQQAAAVFAGSDDVRIRGRVDDLKDLEGRVLRAVLGLSEEAVRLPEGAVVIAEDLLPSQLLALDTARLVGIATAGGGPTSHVAILAAALGVPALAAIGPNLEHVRDGDVVIVDAEEQRLIVRPGKARSAAVATAQRQRDVRLALARAQAAEPCRTADGKRIEVFANLGQVGETAPAVAQGAEGCGLLRTEFLFLDRAEAPDEAEQLEHYQAIADALDGRPLIIRTLDAGGDKPLPYLPMPAEENPALGLRGVRSSLYRPDLLDTQLRAICRVKSAAPVAVMLPMVASATEIRHTRVQLYRAAGDLGVETPLLGVMVETPAMAVTTDLLGDLIDFISVGTNDLTQYVLAMDRQNPGLAHQLDALHPAVLRLIRQAVDGAVGARWTGVCGGLASDPAAIAILIGLGVRELSVAPGMIPEIKAVVRRLTLDGCRRLAEKALALDSAEAVRALAMAHLASLPEPRAEGAAA